MDSGLAARVSVGTGGAETVTVTLFDTLPPSPVQVSVSTMVVVSGPVVSDPLVGLLPLQPRLAVQTVAFLVDQDRVAAFPTSTDVGVTDNVMRGLLAGAPQAANDNRDATSPIVSSLTRNINFLSREPAPREASRRSDAIRNLEVSADHRQSKNSFGREDIRRTPWRLQRAAHVAEKPSAPGARWPWAGGASSGTSVLNVALDQATALQRLAYTALPTWRGP